jgi:hypothetical protein
MVNYSKLLICYSKKKIQLGYKTTHCSPKWATQTVKIKKFIRYLNSKAKYMPKIILYSKTALKVYLKMTIHDYFDLNCFVFSAF